MDKRKEKGERAREKILVGAEAVFLRWGYAGTSMKGVAAAAGVTQSLIHHYFGTKKELWRAVEERRMEAVFRSLRPALTEASRADDFPGEFVRIYGEFLGKEPEFVRILGWMNSDEERRGEGEFTGKGAPLANEVEKHQGRRRIRQDVDPFALMAVLWGLTEAWALGGRRYAERLGESYEKLEKDYRDAVQKILSAGLRSSGSIGD